MNEINDTLRPVSDPLPSGLRDFLEAGGWWLVLGVAALVVLLVLLLILRGLLRALFRRKPAPGPRSDDGLTEDLSACPLPTRPPGERRLTVYGIPVRLRLVVVAPPGKDADVDPTTVENLLERVVPGLGTAAQQDRPRIRIWPPQMSHQGFTVSFHRHTPTPEREGQPSRWVLVAGRAQLGKQPVLLGLGLWADEPCTIGRLTLEPHQWLDVLRCRSEG